MLLLHGEKWSIEGLPEGQCLAVLTSTLDLSGLYAMLGLGDRVGDKRYFQIGRQPWGPTFAFRWRQNRRRRKIISFGSIIPSFLSFFPTLLPLFMILRLLPCFPGLLFLLRLAFRPSSNMKIRNKRRRQRLGWPQCRRRLTYCRLSDDFRRGG